MRLSEVRPGVWKVVVYAGLDPATGKQRQRTKTFHAKGKQAAERAAHKHITTLQADVKADASRMETLNGLVDEWERKRNAADSPSTVATRKATIARIRKALGSIRLEQLTSRHVDQWMTDLLAAGLSETNVFNHYSMLRAILRQGERWDMVSTTDAVRRAQPPSKRIYRKPEPPTDAALDVLVASAPRDLRVCAELASEVGMRRGEIVALRWIDIDWGGFVNVKWAAVDLGQGKRHTKIPKSRDVRAVPASPEFRAVLAEHYYEQEEIARRQTKVLSPVMPSTAFVVADLGTDPTGATPRRAGWLTLAWLRHRRKHGSAATFHDLRHWSATSLLDAGVSPAVVQKRLGHKLLSTTLNVYSHAVAASELEAASTISRRRNRATTPELPAP